MYTDLLKLMGGLTNEPRKERGFHFLTFSLTHILSFFFSFSLFSFLSLHSLFFFLSLSSSLPLFFFSFVFLSLPPSIPFTHTNTHTHTQVLIESKWCGLLIIYVDRCVAFSFCMSYCVECLKCRSFLYILDFQRAMRWDKLQKKKKKKKKKKVFFPLVMNYPSSFYANDE